MKSECGLEQTAAEQGLLPRPPETGLLPARYIEDRYADDDTIEPQQQTEIEYHELAKYRLVPVSTDESGFPSEHEPNENAATQCSCIVECFQKSPTSSPLPLGFFLRSSHRNDVPTKKARRKSRLE